jgi:hypothetical protein
MTDSIKREIERLLDEPGDPAANGQESEQESEQGSGRLRSRLTATLSEGLGDASVSSSEEAVRDLASVAAFIDGQLSGAERDKFVADLAQHQNFRADLESTAALVRATEDNKLQVPKHLLAQAGAQFAPTPAPQTTSPWDPAAFFAGLLLPRRRLALVMVAALALIVAVPAGLLIRGPSGGGAQPELSGVEEPVKDTSQKDKACEDKAKEDKSKDMAKADKSKSKDLSKDPSKDASIPAIARLTAAAPKNNCENIFSGW